jgi:hypothetical protein
MQPYSKNFKVHVKKIHNKHGITSTYLESLLQQLQIHAIHHVCKLSETWSLRQAQASEFFIVVHEQDIYGKIYVTPMARSSWIMFFMSRYLPFCRTIAR